MKLPKEIENYILSHIDDEDPLLSELYRETHVKILHARMCSGHMQGSILTLLSKIVRPQFILEVGTFTGYSAICLSKGLVKDGTIHTIEKSDEMEVFAKKYFEKAGLTNKIIQHIGDVSDIIPKLNIEFDMVFMDADKRAYPEHYHSVLPKVRINGIIIIDNTLWGGKVIKKNLNKDEQTEGIVHFNNIVKQDKRVETYMIPIRDGITVLRKIAD